MMGGYERQVSRRSIYVFFGVDGQGMICLGLHQKKTIFVAKKNMSEGKRG